ncbi:MAG: hypothetical protein LBR64_09745 [Dysgonamonadaceae bacterium]|jgi:hypothetical protein|nr:hypothetical protein [Dysgonamonadaceae bacterium]
MNKTMVVESINNEVIIRMPSFLGIDTIQRMIDLMSFKEATIRSQAKQEDIDALAKEVNRGWWSKNRSRFIK